MEAPEKFNPIIENLSRIDKAADEEQSKAAKKREDLFNEFEAKKSEYNDALRAEAAQRLDELKRRLDEETKEKLSEARKDYELRAGRLDDEFARNKDTWAENIFYAIIEG